jgi:ATP-dependent exoDNAse (exonuclease V) alpha subunit
MTVDVSSSVTRLNVQQQKLYNVIVAQYRAELAATTGFGDPVRPLLLNVDGAAGSGKTFTLQKACSQIQEMAAAAHKPNPIFRAAPTGVAAFNFQGKTLHSLLRLPVRKQAATEVSEGTLQALQALFRDCRFLIIDEKSMVDLRMLSIIDQRLRAIFPRQSDVPFGGLNILICGDFFQLLPVGGKALFSTGLTDAVSIAGSGLYRNFDRTLRLTEIMRQQGEDDIAIKFRAALEQLRSSSLMQESWELLSSRVQNQLPPAEVSRFDDALRLYFTNIRVHEYNYERLTGLNVPVRRISARHRGAGASKATDEEAEGLASELYISIGARVMLTQNLWTEMGLVNGALGIVRDISWLAGPVNPGDMPEFILVEFDQYSGPEFGDCGSNRIPVFLSTRQFDLNSIACARVQFPLRLAYALTVHKSQGLTLSQIVTDLSDKEHTIGLSYVAVSRVKSLQGLLFETAFAFDRFTDHDSPVRRDRALDMLYRIAQAL